MNHENGSHQAPSEGDFDDNSSWTTTTKTPVPFSTFYKTKRTPSTGSVSHYKLCDQVGNASINGDGSLFEFDVSDIPAHTPRLERGQLLSHVRVSHVDEHLQYVYIMLNDDWLAATKMLNDTFEQTRLDKQPSIDVSMLKIDEYYVCKSQSSWFRCRLLTKPIDDDLVSVHFIDWGMQRQVPVHDIREIPPAFIRQPICSAQCRLAGVSDGASASVSTLASCHELLNRHEYEMRVLGPDLIILNHNNENVNDHIITLLAQNPWTDDELLEDEFRHQTVLNIGDEHWAILASFRGDDSKNNDFYVLMCDKTTTDVDKALAAIDYHQYNAKEPRSIHPLCVKPRMMVVAPWKNDSTNHRHGDESVGYYRAWIKSIEGDKCRVIFVDYGNEAEVTREQLISCPPSVSTLPWLAIRVRFQQHLTREEFQRFWSRTDAHWLKIKVLRVNTTNYAVQVLVDYTSVVLSEDRRIRLNNSGSSPQEQPKHNGQAKTDEPTLKVEDSSKYVLYELRKKINQLVERLDENDRKNDQRHAQLLAQLTQP